MSAEPKEWGFLFKGPLALAVHAGTKTETRRLPGPRLFLVDGGPWPKGWTFDLAGARREEGPSPAGNVGPYLVAKRIGADTEHRLYPRIQVGHRIWAKETWGDGSKFYPHSRVLYRADAPEHYGETCREQAETDRALGREHRPLEGCRCDFEWRPSILMPRWAARSVREVVSVGLERLQEITVGAISAEGVTVAAVATLTGTPEGDILDLHTAWHLGWDFINGERPDASWKANPWVLPIGWRADAETSGRAA